MSDEREDAEAIPETKPAIPLSSVLPYATPGEGIRLVAVGRFGAVEEAEIMAAELAAEGIRSSVLNGLVNSLGIPYAGMIDVELQVTEEDAPRAREILRRATSDDWEPAEYSQVTPPPVDEAGTPLTLVEAARFDSARKMREAQTALASARITSFLPPLVPRGDRPAGTGDRFVLRVSQDDLARARTFLKEEPDEDEDGEAELRCPKCKAWRVYPVTHFWQGLAAMVGLAQKPEDLIDCLACKYRGPRSEFEAG